jgi:protein-tyrosine kinase
MSRAGKESSDGTGGRRRRSTGGRLDVRAPFEEAYRIVRTNVMASLADVEQPRVAITSANAGEGKTVTCANLAVSFARAGQRVVLVDFDLRHPDAHQLVGAHNRVGMCDLLLGQRTMEECLQYLELPVLDTQSAQGVYFIGAGQPVRNPTELLGTSRTSVILEELGRQADLVLINAPPVLAVADMLVIGRIVSGAILVVEAHRTTVTEVNKARDLLTRQQTPIIGLVLNKARRRDRADDYGYGPAPSGDARPAINPPPPPTNGTGSFPAEQKSRSGR